MKQLWAPWRMKYIDDLNSGNNQECFLCSIIESKKDEENLVLKRGNNSFIVFNKFPYNNAHLLIAPFSHVASLSDLSKDERLEIMDLSALAVDIIKKTMNADGFNCGFNLGKSAGAGLESHIHFHVVPRWIGDCNFLPVLSDTKSLPEYLEDTYKKLKPSFDKA